MKRSQRLQTIIELYANREKDALLAMGLSQQLLQEQQVQLEQLTVYQHEYLAKLVEKQKSGMNVSQLLEFRAFADKLEKAIAGQRKAVILQEREFQKARNHWEEASRRTKSVSRLGEMAVAEELKLENKREQSEQDDIAARLARKDGIRNA